jgi:hypothetical protein
MCKTYHILSISVSRTCQTTKKHSVDQDRTLHFYRKKAMPAAAIAMIQEAAPTAAITMIGEAIPAKEQLSR